MDKCVSDLAASSHGFKAIGAFALITQVSLFALLPLLTACSNSEASAPPPPTIEVAKVVEKNVADWDEYTGRLQAIDYVDIRPRIAGSIDRVAFKEGQVVKRGDLLFEIDPRPYQAEADRTHADRPWAVLGMARVSVRKRRIAAVADGGTNWRFRRAP
jgi:multidrug efflux pump subunit AcrA (membrane-fusion protein)